MQLVMISLRGVHRGRCWLFSRLRHVPSTELQPTEARAPRPRLSPRDTSAGETVVSASRTRRRARVDRLRRNHVLTSAREPLSPTITWSVIQWSVISIKLRTPQEHLWVSCLTVWTAFWSDARPKVKVSSASLSTTRCPILEDSIPWWAGNMSRGVD